MPGTRAFLSALAAAACAVGVVACGGDDANGPIPAEQGNQLLDQLDDIEAAISDGNCDEAQQTAAIFAQNVSALQLSDDRELREALVEASGNLEALTEDADQCEPDIGPSGTTGVVPTTTEPTETTPTTTPEEPTDEEDEGNGPPDQPPGGGNGQPGGGNNGGGSGDGDDDSSGGIGSDG